MAEGDMMNCNECRDAVLLEQSGELESREQDALAKHLDGCAECRAYREGLSAMISAAREMPLGSDVSEFTIRRIMAAGERAHTPAGRRQAAGGRFIELWRPALMSGAAALLLILFGIQFAGRTSSPVAQAPGPDAGVIDGQETDLLAWDAGLDDELEMIESLLAMATDDANGFGLQENGTSLDQLAEELIELESWSI